MFSRVFVFIPPVMMLARHSSRKTICMSAPCAMRSSMAEICPLTSYEASRSRVY